MTNFIFLLTLLYVDSCSTSSAGSLVQAYYPLMHLLENGKWADKADKQEFLQWFFYENLIPTNDSTTFPAVEHMVAIDMSTLRSHGYQWNSPIYWLYGATLNWLLKIVFTNPDLRKFRTWIYNDPTLDGDFKSRLEVDIIYLMSIISRNIDYPPINQHDMEVLYKIWSKNNNQEISGKITNYYIHILRESDNIRTNSSSLVQHGAVDYIQLLRVWENPKAPIATPLYLNAIIITIDCVLSTHTTHNPYSIYLGFRTVHMMIKLIADKILIYFDTALAVHVGVESTSKRNRLVKSKLVPQLWKYQIDRLWSAFAFKVSEIIDLRKDELATFLGKTFIQIYGSIYHDMESIEKTYALLIAAVDKAGHSNVNVVSSPIFYAVSRQWIYIIQHEKRVWFELVANPQCTNWRIWPINLWEDVKTWFSNAPVVRTDFHRVLKNFILFFSTTMNQPAVNKVTCFFKLHYPAEYAEFYQQKKHAGQSVKRLPRVRRLPVANMEQRS